MKILPALGMSNQEREYWQAGHGFTSEDHKIGAVLPPLERTSKEIRYRTRLIVNSYVKGSKKLRSNLSIFFWGGGVKYRVT